MLFSSLTFLYYFLPAVLLCYFIAPKSWRNAVLLVFSLIFYAWGEPKYVFLMMFTILSGYTLGILTEKHKGSSKAKLFLTLAIVIELGMLAIFKYTDFFISGFGAATGLPVKLLKIALPVGISFYTFQILSYNVDVYRGEVPAQRSLVKLACYVTMFPQLIAGPIVRYSHIEKQLDNRTCSFDMAASGIRRFVVGLAKKVIIANSMGALCDAFQGSSEQTVLFFWLYAIAYSLQIYYDFSAYSDMAIGLGKILGFEFMENFNYPYVAKSITEFWRRWHISLGSWFRDYVYIPLGGNRVSKLKWFRNIFVVWLLTGMWHGAAWNFIVWGLYFGVLLVIEKLWLLKRIEKIPVVSHVYVLFLVMISFVIFNASSMQDAVRCIGGLFGSGTTAFAGAESLYYLRSYWVLLVMAVVGATPIVKNFFSGLAKIKAVAAAEIAVSIALVLLCSAYLVDGSFNPFLYFRF